MPVMAHLDLIAQYEDERGQSRRLMKLQTSGELASGEIANVTIHNASNSGMLIETSLPLGIGERLLIDLPEFGKVEARVVWQSGQLTGCQFESQIGNAVLSALQLRSNAPLLAGAGIGPQSRGGGAESFGKRIEQLRKSRGLTLADVARELSVSKPTVWAWEKGKAKPIEDRIPALANVLQIEASELMARNLEPGLAELIADARRDIASACGVNPDRVKIMVDL